MVSSVKWEVKQVVLLAQYLARERDANLTKSLVCSVLRRKLFVHQSKRRDGHTGQPVKQEIMENEELHIEE